MSDSNTKKKAMDMINGSLWNKILIFALPLAASSILQQLFNSVDTAVVGRFASSQALAAVGSNSSLISLMINLFIGISLGSNVVIAHYIGQRAEKNIQAAVHTAMVVAVISGVFVMIAGQFIAKPVLLLMGTPDDVIDLAVLYLRIYLLGMPFIMLYDFGSSILRSTGDSKRPLYSLIVAGIVNTVLNLILVIVFKLGQRKNVIRVAKRFFTQAECDWIGNDSLKFSRIWTLKEAYAKLTGEGIAGTVSKAEFRHEADNGINDAVVADNAICSDNIEKVKMYISGKKVDNIKIYELNIIKSEYAISAIEYVSD